MVWRGGEMVSIKLERTVIKKFCNRVYEEDIFFNNEEPAACSWVIFFFTADNQ